MLSIVIAIADSVLDTDDSIGSGLLLGLYGVAVLLPTMPVSVRRLHGIGRSGWWALIGLVPLIGFVVLLVLHATEGDNGDNQYSPDPKNAEVRGCYEDRSLRREPEVRIVGPFHRSTDYHRLSVRRRIADSDIQPQPLTMATLWVSPTGAFDIEPLVSIEARTIEITKKAKISRPVSLE